MGGGGKERGGGGKGGTGIVLIKWGGGKGGQNNPSGGGNGGVAIVGVANWLLTGVGGGSGVWSSNKGGVSTVSLGVSIKVSSSILMLARCSFSAFDTAWFTPMYRPSSLMPCNILHA